MKVHVAADAVGMSEAAAAHILDVIIAKPDAALLIATGNSPLASYAVLARRVRAEAIDVSRLRIFQLDEYVDLARTDPRTLYGWMDRALLTPLAIPPANVVRLPSQISDEAAVRRDYEAAVAAVGGFDLAVLGLGPNGHLGFNEPPSGPDAPTRIIDLTPESLISNSGYWGGIDQVPRRAITAGLDLILGSKAAILIVPGAHKRDILHRSLGGPETPDLPASYLRRVPGAVYCDRAAWGDTPVPATVEPSGGAGGAFSEER